MKVVIIGPSITRTKGGMATVIQDMLRNSGNGVDFRHIVSHVEGGATEKIARTLKATAAFMAEGGADVVHIHVSSGASFYRKAFFAELARRRGIPVIMHVHGADFDSFYLNASATVRKLIRKVFSRCSKVLVLSTYWKDFFVEHVTQGNVEILRNGVYTDVFGACYTMPHKLNGFLFLGRLGQRKGVYDLLEAVDILVNQRQRTGLLFYLAGDGEVDEVAALVQQKGLEAQVRVLGWIGEEDKIRWLKEADTMVLPSYNEGLPMSILESMAAGKVIISTGVGGIPELVEHGVNGFLITPGDVEALAGHLDHVSRSPEEMTRIAAANQEKIDTEYNLARLNERLLELYREVVAATGKAKK